MLGRADEVIDRVLFAAPHWSAFGTKLPKPIRQACPLLAKAAVMQRILVSELGSKRWNKPQGSGLAQCRVECTLPIRQVDDSIVLTRPLAFNGWGHFLMLSVCSPVPGNSVAIWVAVPPQVSNQIVDCSLPRKTKSSAQLSWP
jgi:hypothetical protein